MKLGLHYKKVSIVPYDPDWVLYYKQEQTLLQQVLGYLCKDIQHVGSTAVEGMPSKPIIDIAIALVDISYLDEAIDILAQLGYFYLLLIMFMSQHGVVLPGEKSYYSGTFCVKNRQRLKNMPG